ncbi:hypothetical protein BgiBS90_018840, partial [Biomphalaria glabrata]
KRTTNQIAPNVNNEMNAQLSEREKIQEKRNQSRKKKKGYKKRKLLIEKDISSEDKELREKETYSKDNAIINIGNVSTTAEIKLHLEESNDILPVQKNTVHYRKKPTSVEVT